MRDTPTEAMIERGEAVGVIWDRTTTVTTFERKVRRAEKAAPKPEAKPDTSSTRARIRQLQREGRMKEALAHAAELERHR